MGIFGHDTYPASNWRSGCLQPDAMAARQKITGRIKRRLMKRRSCAGQKTGRNRNPDGASAWWTLAGPFLSWCVARGKPHARHAPSSLQLEVSRFVIVARPAARSGRERILFECPHRASCRSPSPTGQENEIAPDVCRWFVRSLPRAVSRVGWRSAKTASRVALLACRSGVRTFGAACWLANVAGLAYWALWLPRRAAWRCWRIACPFIREAATIRCRRWPAV